SVSHFFRDAFIQLIGSASFINTELRPRAMLVEERFAQQVFLRVSDHRQADYEQLFGKRDAYFNYFVRDNPYKVAIRLVASMNAQSAIIASRERKRSIRELKIAFIRFLQFGSLILGANFFASIMFTVHFPSAPFFVALGLLVAAGAFALHMRGYLDKAVGDCKKEKVRLCQYLDRLFVLPNEEVVVEMDVRVPNENPDATEDDSLLRVSL
ncbi:MAG: hypothetical protein KDH94_08840, partial [Coxiellaceae bacterium]|nr:hypothetical protein [Coxiellaceae bacterium]